MKGLYIHIPFCVSKCKYCDFASYTGDYELMHKYTTTLIREASMYSGLEFDTVYIGGGTPTCLEARCLEKVLNMVKTNFKLADGFEFTIESNPGTVDIQKAQLMKKHGVNRISLGAQSFVDSELKYLGRIHTAQTTEDTFKLLRMTGFDNISLDLMFGIPGQTIDSLGKSVNRVLKLMPEHISCYALKIEENTPFYDMHISGELLEKDEDEFADMYDYIVDKLGDNGYLRYEISNFASKGMISRHNTKYWKCEEYLGLGLGAASYIDGRRFTKSASFDDYFNGFILSEDIQLTNDDKMSEFVILGLRLINEGINTKEFKSRFNKDFFDVFGCMTDKFLKLGMLDIQGENIRLTDRGTYVSNAILCEFML